MLALSFALLLTHSLPPSLCVCFAPPATVSSRAPSLALTHYRNVSPTPCLCTQKRTPTPERQPYYRMGFPVGCAIGQAANSMTVCTVHNIDNMYAEEVFINNHIDLVIDYHTAPEFEVRVSDKKMKEKRVTTITSSIIHFIYSRALLTDSLT